MSRGTTGANIRSGVGGAQWVCATATNSASFTVTGFDSWTRIGPGSAGWAVAGTVKNSLPTRASEQKSNRPMKHILFSPWTLRWEAARDQARTERPLPPQEPDGQKHSSPKRTDGHSGVQKTPSRAAKAASSRVA